MYSNYPPGMRESDIPGIDDEDLHYRASWMEVVDLQEDEAIFNLPSLMKEWLGVEVTIDWSTLLRINGSYSIFVEYEGDICAGPHDDYDEVQQYALEDLNQEINTRNFFMNDDDLEIIIIS